MSLSSLSLKRPVFAIVMNIVIVLFGVIGFKFLGVREYPSIDPPTITVRTNYTGANSDVIESQITEPLEKAINGIEGIRTISSSSNLGSSVITVEFNVGYNLEAAANDVRDKVSQAIRQLPQDIDAPPVVTKADANSDAIISMTVQSNTKNKLQISDYASNVLLDKLQTIPGVSNVQIWGEQKYAMRIWVKPLQLAAYHLAFSDIETALNKENVELPAGKIYGNSTELTVKTFGRLATEDDFNNLIIKADNNRIIRLRDVAEVILGPENEETVLKESGVPMVALALIPQPGSNYIEIAKEFYKRYDQIKKDVPADIQLNIALDSTKFVERSVEEVGETLAIAFLLVVIIIYLFFRNWLIAIRPLIDIPVSLIGAFFIMYVAGFSINILTLLAIVLATGLVVDDGIVVTENIFKKIEEGMPVREAAEKGSNEIFFAVIATSITLAVVFLPIVFLQGFVGSLFREFGIVLAGAVLISAFVSLTLTPVLNVLLSSSDTSHGWFYHKTEPFYRAMDDGYRGTLTSFMSQRWVAIPIVLLCAGGIVLFSKLLQSELAPLEDRSLFRMQVLAPEGTSYDYMENYTDRVVRFLLDSIPEKKIVLNVVAPGFAGSGAVNTGFVRVALKEPDERKRSQQQIVNMVNRNLGKFNEGKLFAIQEQTISVGLAARTSLPVQFVIQNMNFDSLRSKLPLFLEEANKSKVFQGVDVNLKFNKPELQITVDRLKAAELGVSVLDISRTLQLALSAGRLGYFIMSGKQYQVIAQVDRGDRDQPLDLKSFYVRNNKGELIQLDNLVKMEEQSSPPQLYHYARYKSATVSAGLAPGYTVGDGIAEMEAIKARVLDETFSTALTGSSRDFAESSSNTSFAFMLALVLIFLILAAQFESFIDPIIIMVTVPLAVAGAFLSLWMFNQTLNIFSQIGIIMLIGLVTKNGILIVEFANQKVEAGEDRLSAVIDAAALRLRPILMTSLATALGALPIALALGSGAQSRVSLGIVVIGGLMFSLILTLFVIPSMYILIPAFVKWIGSFFRSKKATTATVILLLVSATTMQAQDLLTVEQAVEIALKNNYDIQIAKNTAEIAHRNNTPGNAGMLPTVGATLGDNFTLNNLNQKFTNGTEINKNNVTGNNLNAGVALNWTVFDGLQMFAAKGRLKRLEQIGELQFKDEMQTVMANVITAYYDVVRAQQQLRAIDSAISISNERVKLAETKFQVGTASKVDLLQAKVDLNEQRSSYLAQQKTILQRKADLNNLLARNIETQFEVTDSIPYNEPTLSTDMDKNFQLQVAAKNVEVAKFQKKEAFAGYLPRLTGTVGYSYTRANSTAGFSLFNQSYGLNAGFGLSIPLFNGLNTIRLNKVATLQLQSSQFNLERVRFQTKLAHYRAVQDFANAKEVLKLEEDNIKLADENQKIALERFRLAQSTAIELREAQVSYVNALTRLVNARYSAKAAETELLRLQGELIKGN
jgi:multidrug efflux pump